MRVCLTATAYVHMHVVEQTNTNTIINTKRSFGAFFYFAAVNRPALAAYVRMLSGAVQKKKKRPGKQARDRKKAGLEVRLGKQDSTAALTQQQQKAEWPAELEERWLVCADCSVDFCWPVDEQTFFQEQGFGYVPPTRCVPCRKAKTLRVSLRT